MKRLSSKEDERKKQKRNQIVIGIILVVVMLGSSFGIIVETFGDNENSATEKTYNGYNFVNQGEYWVVSTDKGNFAFQDLPEDVNISLGKTDKSLNEYSGRPLYIQSQNSDAGYLVYLNLGQIAQRVQEACLNSSECETEDVPIKDCTNNFIIIEPSEETVLFKEDKCVFIRAPEENLTLATEEFLYQLIGVK